MVSLTTTTTGNPAYCLEKQLVSFLVPCNVGFTISAPLIHTNPHILVYATVTQPVWVTYAIVSGPTDFLSTHRVCSALDSLLYTDTYIENQKKVGHQICNFTLSSPGHCFPCKWEKWYLFYMIISNRHIFPFGIS